MIYEPQKKEKYIIIIISSNGKRIIIYNKIKE